jgi:hypothetical protein
MVDLRGPLLNGHHLVLHRGQLLLKGLLGLSSTCNDSRSQTQHRDLAKHTEPARGDVGNLPSITTWRSAIVSFAFRLASSSFFFRSAASLCAWRAMASLTRWTSCAASTRAYSFASRAAVASACVLALPAVDPSELVLVRQETAPKARKIVIRPRGTQRPKNKKLKRLCQGPLPTACTQSCVTPP